MRADRPKILVFSRSFLAKDFRKNFAPLADRYDLRFVTDGHAPGTDDTRASFYQHLRSGATCSELSDDERDDVVRRCRMLRKIDRQWALRLVNAMALALAEEFDRIAPDAVVCQMVDEYVTHLVSVLSRKRGLASVGYAFSYFPNLVQITLFERGEAFDVRTPSLEEAREVINTVTNTFFRQNYGQPSKYSFLYHINRILRYRLKQAVFATRGLIENDPWNVHFKILPHTVERRWISDYPRSEDFDADWLEKVEAARSAGRPVVYFPIGYHPESTIDYWTPNVSIVDYEQRVAAIARRIGGRMTILLKEHPQMIGARSRAFYKTLSSIPGSVVIHPHEYSNVVVDTVDAILLGAGSGGLEGVLRDKPVFSFVSTSYWFKWSNANYVDLDQLEAWPAIIETGLRDHRPMLPEEKEQFIIRCLASTIRSQPGVWRWPVCEPNDLDELLSRAVEAGPRGQRARPTLQASRS